MKRKSSDAFHTVSKYSALGLLTTGIIIWDQIRRIKVKISQATSPKVWIRATQQPEFIYITDVKTEDLLTKFEIGGITNELYKIAQLYLWISGKLKQSQVYDDLFSMHQNLAWRLLQVAQDPNYYHRQRAIHALATMQNLSDSTCFQIAQSCDMETAISLSRIDGVDVRILKDPPNWRKRPDKKEILNQLQHMLITLNKEVPHPCLQYVISKVFADRDHQGFDDDVGFNVSTPDAISKCVEAILHHSWIETTARSIVELGGLSLLVDIYKLNHDEASSQAILIMLSRILSNISMDTSCRRLIFESGWLKILSQMMQNDNIHVSLPAARALMNCDLDTPPMKNQQRFLRNLYQLHPTKKILHREPLVDVIFVHGLLGSVFITWRQRDLDSIDRSRGKETNDTHVDLNDFPVDGSTDANDLIPVLRRCEKTDVDERRTQCWPRDWLPKDCPDIRVLGVNYDTNLSMWTPMCPIAPARKTLNDRSSHLLKVLEEAGVGSRPIVWVAHSMGGLIVKDLLVKCHNSEEASQNALVKNTKSIIFFSTPHKGSRLATWNTTSQMLIWPTIEVKELRQDSPVLLDLHKKFINLVHTNPIEVVSFAERHPTYIKALKLELRFVENESANADVGNMYGVPLDHLCICKPQHRASFLYQKIIHVIHGTLTKTKERV